MPSGGQEGPVPGPIARAKGIQKHQRQNLVLIAASESNLLLVKVGHWFCPVPSCIGQVLIRSGDLRIWALQFPVVLLGSSDQNLQMSLDRLTAAADWREALDLSSISLLPSLRPPRPKEGGHRNNLLEGVSF